MSEELEATPTGLGRRQFIKSSAAVGGLVWAAPAMSTFGARAFAGSPDKDLCPDGTLSGQVRNLVWEYRPDLIVNDAPGACSIADQTAACGAVCTFDADAYPNGETVNIQVTGGGVPLNYTESWAPYETKKVPPNDGLAGATQEFRVLDKDQNVIHYVKVHTSCSCDLAIGDRFGAFLLKDGAPN